jgi:hypothetical protein
MDAIAFNLEHAFFGIVCLTRENFASPWINFEAGALSKHVTIDRVSPLLIDIGITELGPSPLAQFQATFTEKADFKRLLRSVAEQSKLPHALSNLEVYIDNFWIDFDEKLRIAAQMGAIPSKSIEISKTEAQLNELARQLNAISYKLNSPEKLLPPEYIKDALSSTTSTNGPSVQGADLEGLVKRLEYLSNFSWAMSSHVDSLLSQAESIVTRLEQDDVPENLQIDLIGDLNQLIAELSSCEDKIERVL